MSAAKGILIRPSSQSFRIETSFSSSSTGAPVTSGSATASMFAIQDDGTLRAVDFSLSPPAPLSSSAGVPVTPTLALACQSSAGASQPYWSAVLANVTGLTLGGVYLITFAPPSGAATPTPKIVQFGQLDGDGAVNPVLAANGVDNILVEIGLNLRQAMALLAAAVAGTDSGVGTSTVVMKGAGVATTRLSHAIDGSGNRTTTISPPA